MLMLCFPKIVFTENICCNFPSLVYQDATFLPGQISHGTVLQQQRLYPWNEKVKKSYFDNCRVPKPVINVRLCQDFDCNKTLSSSLLPNGPFIFGTQEKTFLTSLKQTCNEYLYLNINKCKLAFLGEQENIPMLSTCSELTPRAPIPDGRMERLLDPWVEQDTCCLNVRLVS